MSSSVGQIAYDAYCAAVGGKSAVTGAPLPTWDAQSDAIKAAWEAAGTAVSLWTSTWHQERK